MGDTFRIGDFDLEINEVLLVHRCIFVNRYQNSDYRGGRGVSGVVYCISGTAQYDFGDRQLTLSPGGLIFLPASSSYVVRGAGSEPFSHITANFTVRGSTDSDKNVVSELLSGRLHHVTGKENAAVFRALLDRLLTAWQSKQYGYKVLSKSVLYELLYLYFTDAGRSGSAGGDYNRVLPAKAALDENYMENLPVCELAALCGLSETHFRRLFSHLFGASPTDYRLNKRILKAKDLLLSGEFSVAAAAAAVGFNDPSYFSRLFKLRTGISPSQIGISDAGNITPVEVLGEWR